MNLSITLGQIESLVPCPAPLFLLAGPTISVLGLPGCCVVMNDYGQDHVIYVNHVYRREAIDMSWNQNTSVKLESVSLFITMSSPMPLPSPLLTMAVSAEKTDPQSNTSPRSTMSLNDEPQEGEQSDRYQTPPHGLKEWLFIIVLCSTQFFVQGSFGYILIPLHIVGQSFGQGPSEASQMTWHVGGYSLTVGTFILIAGKLGDLYGSRRILIVGWAWFGVWSVIGGCSAFTHSPVFFDTARALQGIGPALLLPNALAIAARTYPPGKKKNMIFSALP
jgi:hypothetical protein